jgi:hypothetical protein
VRVEAQLMRLGTRDRAQRTDASGKHVRHAGRNERATTGGVHASAIKSSDGDRPRSTLQQARALPTDKGTLAMHLDPPRGEPSRTDRPVEGSSIHLPEPGWAPTLTVAEALRVRRTDREIGSTELGHQTLANLLFAAHGVNRPRGPFGAPGHTSASASNSSEVDVYVLLAGGAYRFDAPRNVLSWVTGEDLRLLAFGPRQPLICPHAPVHLVYVVDRGKLEHTRGFDEPGLHDAAVQKSYYYVDTGITAGNVYLFAASEGLACWFHNCDRGGLAKSLELTNTQEALFAQTLGYAMKPDLGCP